MKTNIIRIIAGALILVTVFAIISGENTIHNIIDNDTDYSYNASTKDDDKEEEDSINYDRMIDDFTSNSSNTFALTVGEEHFPSGCSWAKTSYDTLYSSDNSVVKISRDGTVIAVGEGSAYFIIVLDSGAYFIYRYDIYAPVPEADLSNLPEIDGVDFAFAIEKFNSVPQNTTTLKIGKTHSPIAWGGSQYYVSDDSVINVDSSGTVTAVGRGTAYLIIVSSTLMIDVHKYIVIG